MNLGIATILMTKCVNLPEFAIKMITTVGENCIKKFAALNAFYEREYTVFESVILLSLIHI